MSPPAAGTGSSQPAGRGDVLPIPGVALDPRAAASLAAYQGAAAEYQEFWKNLRPRDAARKFGAMAGNGARVIDIACGPGLDVRLLRDMQLRVVAGDLSEECMKVGKLLHPKGSLALWDYRRLPFADNTFDGVWASAALQHLPRTKILPALAEICRVQAGGPIFLSFREGAGDLEPVDDPPAGQVYVTTVSSDQLRALLLRAGYTDVEVETRVDPVGRRDVTWLYGWGLRGSAPAAGSPV